MRFALGLAENGRFTTAPNPMVGAIVVNDGRIVGQGWHKQAGGPHAERVALADAGIEAHGATIYVTLEPCSHTGRTGPCTEAILEAGISRVVIGASDPNPKAAGGAEVLRNAGLDVVTGVLKEECEALNRDFLDRIRNRRPFVTMKIAMTADGHTSTASGASKWITGEESRKHVHEDRGRSAVILTGVGTVFADNPALTCRVGGGKDPIRVVLDTHLRIPADATLAMTAAETPTILACCDFDPDKAKALEDSGCEIWMMNEKDGRVDLSELIARIGAEGYDSVFIEAGPTVAWSALSAGVVDKLQIYVAPKIFGGTGRTAVGGPGVPLPKDAFQLCDPRITPIGDDILVEYDIKHPERSS